MIKNFTETTLSIIEKSSKSIISSVDENGYPNLKAMLKPREIEGIKVFYLQQLFQIQ